MMEMSKTMIAPVRALTGLPKAMIPNALDIRFAFARFPWFSRPTINSYNSLYSLSSSRFDRPLAIIEFFFSLFASRQSTEKAIIVVEGVDLEYADASDGVPVFAFRPARCPPPPNARSRRRSNPSCHGGVIGPDRRHNPGREGGASPITKLPAVNVNLHAHR